MAWHVVAKAEEVGEGQVRAASAAQTMLALYKIDGTYYATSNICTHAVALLSDGYLDGDCIECPVHAALFHVPTGEARSEPATEPLQTFPVKVEGEMLMVEIAE
ncbi:non-heme iron oxygenase ferredoxin subunit [Roseiarcaceae bacterium H3SJ34-1]|uniref:non-heme iron oxygenase ferredoxin subunit n=1 Tax=Terripilifer ovatus TaxID=3032367 RepID=UPI003AB96CC4|nr:non-heme iron oxygenase ferredoxin subunit [Roseiarcaceae bacterium H3SJ34-1]